MGRKKIEVVQIKIDGKLVDAKECTKCGDVKPLSEYQKDNSKKSHYSKRKSTCKLCRNKTNVRKSEVIQINTPTGEMSAKKCSKCREIKTLDEFSDNDKVVSGKRSQCKECYRAYRVERYKENREIELQKSKDYRTKNVEKIKLLGKLYRIKKGDCLKKKRRDHRNKNIEHYRKKSCDWKKSNKDKVSAYNSLWNKLNKEKRRAINLKRTTVKKNLPYSATYNYVASFNLSSKEHLDHFIPISLGHGGSYEGNLIDLTATENISKKAKHPFDWAYNYYENDYEGLSDFIGKARQLAKLNALTLDEYRQFIDWCFANPRTIREIKVDNERYGYTVHSIELYQEATGIQFPLPAFALNEIGNRLTDAETAPTVTA